MGNNNTQGKAMPFVKYDFEIWVVFPNLGYEYTRTELFGSKMPRREYEKAHAVGTGFKTEF